MDSSEGYQAHHYPHPTPARAASPRTDSRRRCGAPGGEAATARSARRLLPSEHAHATRSTVADRRLSQLAAAYALWMLFSGVGAQQPTAARRCGSFRIAAVQLLSEAVDVERGRFSKIRARLSTRLLALSTTSVTQGHGSQRRGHEVSGQNPTFINRPPLRSTYLGASGYWPLTGRGPATSPLRTRNC